MNEALIDNTAVNLDNPVKEEQIHKPLRSCVEDAVEMYLKQLDGHTTTDFYKVVLQEIEEPLLRCVLRHTHGNQSKASEMLGINRGTLRKKLKLYDLHN